MGAAAWTAYAKGGREEALTLMRFAADMEDKSEKSAVTPGRIIPARELLGEMLLEMKRPAEALQAFETSEKHDPTVFAVSMARAKARRSPEISRRRGAITRNSECSCKMPIPSGLR